MKKTICMVVLFISFLLTSCSGTTTSRVYEITYQDGSTEILEDFVLCNMKAGTVTCYDAAFFPGVAKPVYWILAEKLEEINPENP